MKGLASALREAAEPSQPSLADIAYARLKASLFDFELLPGDRFSETEVAARLRMSRTPVRDALYRLECEGYLQVQLRVGWSVQPFDFKRFEDFYDLRLILEEASVVRLCELAERPGLAELQSTWMVAPADRSADPRQVSELDEAFHMQLVHMAGNAEAARCHREVTERIRIIRRLDFTQPQRIQTTYEEHAQILRAVIRRRAAEANRLLRSHIETSKAEVRKITLHRLYTARAGQHAGEPGLDRVGPL